MVINWNQVLTVDPPPPSPCWNLLNEICNVAEGKRDDKFCLWNPLILEMCLCQIISYSHKGYYLSQFLPFFKILWKYRQIGFTAIIWKMSSCHETWQILIVLFADILLNVFTSLLIRGKVWLRPANSGGSRNLVPRKNLSSKIHALVVKK